MITLRKKSGDNRLVIFIISSFLITMLLFFIDEGNYNLKWMTSLGSWIAFSIYLFSILLGKLLTSVMVLGRYHGRGKTALSIVLGAAFGIIFTIGVVFTNW